MSIALFLSMIASVFLSFSIPVFFWGRFGYKTKGFFSSVIIGAAAYLIYFLIIRTSALSLTANLHIFPASLLRAIFFSLGLTLMNFIAYKMLKMTGRDLRCSYAVGVGTALAENAVVVGMAYINNIFYSIMIMNGSFDAHMAEVGFDSATISMLREALAGMSASSFFLSAFERMLFSFAMVYSAYAVYSYWDSSKKGRAVLYSSLVLFVSYFIPSILSASSDESLVYVSMSLLAVISILCTWIMSRKGQRNNEEKKEGCDEKR